MNGACNVGYGNDTPMDSTDTCRSSDRDSPLGQCTQDVELPKNYCFLGATLVCLGVLLTGVALTLLTLTPGALGVTGAIVFLMLGMLCVLCGSCIGEVHWELQQSLPPTLQLLLLKYGVGTVGRMTQEALCSSSQTDCKGHTV